MREWNIRQKQLMADYFNNISAGWLLLDVVTPFLAGMRMDIVNLSRITLSLISSNNGYSSGFYCS